MPEQLSAPRLEIAHVLFMDIVGYSKLPIDQEQQLFRQLQHLVSSTAEFIRAEAADLLIRLPTGDGKALVCESHLRTPNGPRSLVTDDRQGPQ